MEILICETCLPSIQCSSSRSQGVSYDFEMQRGRDIQSCTCRGAVETTVAYAGLSFNLGERLTYTMM